MKTRSGRTKACCPHPIAFRGGGRLTSIRSKLLISYMLILVLPCMLLGGGFLHAYDRAAIDRGYAQLQEEALLLAENVNHTLNGYGEVFSDFCYSQEIWQYFYHRYAYPDSSIEGYYTLIRPTIARYRALHPEILKATLFTDNETVVTNDSEIAPLRGSQWEAFYPLEKGNTWYFAQTRLGARDAWMFARTLELYGKRAGMFVLYLDVGALLDAIREETASGGNEFYVITPGDLVLLGDREESIGKTMQGQPLGDGAAFSGRPEVTRQTWEGVEKIVASKPFQVTNCPGTWYLLCMETEREMLALVSMNHASMIALLIAMVALMIVVSICVAHYLTMRLETVADGIRRLAQGDFSVRVKIGGKDEINVLGDSLNHMAGRLESLIAENTDIKLSQEKLKTANNESQLNALKSQINPHFIFNTLEAIGYGIEAGLPGTERAVMLLARSLRRSVDWSRERIPLAEELAFVQEHLEIQKFRYGEKLAYRMDVPEELLNTPIPTMLLQPLVENAANHGVAMKHGKGSIGISACIQGERLCIRVADDGVGMDEIQLEELRASLANRACPEDGKYIGLKNVHDRIKLTYGEGAAFLFDSKKGVGTEVTLLIPLTPAREMEEAHDHNHGGG
ncbi:MAG: histidine kinase [Candidatus Limiplasma sp.]|nr:histidine kinase [Candidatus Limiplasma sp.]